MQDRAESLALEAAREGGKPLTDSRVEVARAIDGVLNCAELLRSEAGQVIPMNLNGASMGRIAFMQREPIGVVVAVNLLAGCESAIPACRRPRLVLSSGIKRCCEWING
jgi:acyl-CoA reductase-like NAD-dependent aldehyde dehydrogenase